MIRSTLLLAALAFLSRFAVAEDAPEVKAGPKGQIQIRVQVLSMNAADWGDLYGGPTVKLPLLEAATQDVLDRVAVYREMKLVRMHAETTLTTTERNPAQLMVGGQYPVPVPQAIRPPTIEWRNYGQIVEVMPVSRNDGAIELNCAVENSWLDTTTAVEFEGVQIPGVNKRRIHSQVRLKPDEIALAATPDDENRVSIVLMTPGRVK